MANLFEELARASGNKLFQQRQSLPAGKELNNIPLLLTGPSSSISKGRASRATGRGR